MFLPINVAYNRCTEAVCVWWGCIAPYSHSLSSGRGGGREREEWEELPKVLHPWLGFILRKGYGGEQCTNVNPAMLRIWMHYSPSTYKWNKMYSQIQLRRHLQPLWSGCGFGPSVGCWYLCSGSSPGCQCTCPVHSDAGGGWLWLSSKGRRSHRWYLLSSQWAHLWWLSITGPFYSKAQRTLKLCLNCGVHRMPALGCFCTGTGKREKRLS